MQMQQPDNQTTDGSTVITLPQRAHFSAAAALPVVFSSAVLCNDSNFFFMIDTTRCGCISINIGSGEYTEARGWVATHLLLKCNQCSSSHLGREA